METKRPASEDVYHLEKWIQPFVTPYGEVCRVLGEGAGEPGDFLEVEDCVFLFDSEKGYVFSGAVVMSDAYGFYGLRVGANWLEAAGTLESQDFEQAEDLERFTKRGQNFNISVYLYPDDNPNTSLSTVKDYSICIRYGRNL